MPLFEFVCGKCRNEFEELVMHADEEILCPKCGSKKIVKKMSRFAFKAGEGKRMRTSVKRSGSSCSTCRPGPGGCSGCS
jgi:putative FmdB family regulatory protein